MKRKICVVITARPSYARVRSALAAMRDGNAIDLRLIVTGPALLARYGKVVDVIEAEGFSIDRKLAVAADSDDLAAAATSTGAGIMALAEAFEAMRPDLVMTIADRYETMAAAVAAATMHIPLVHLQGGEVSGSIDEKVRHAVTKLADIHLVSTQRAADRVIALGEKRERVFVTGCPSIDLARAAMMGTAQISNGLPPEAEAAVAAGGYLVVVQHPVTNQRAQARQQIEETLEAVALSGREAFWFSSNIDAGSTALAEAVSDYRRDARLAEVRFLCNLAPDSFLRLLSASGCLVGNSSVALREGAYLGLPAVNIGARQANRERGANVIDVGHDRQEIQAAIASQLARGRLPCDPLYGDGEAGVRIAGILARVPLMVDKQIAF